MSEGTPETETTKVEKTTVEQTTETPTEQPAESLTGSEQPDNESDD